MRKGRGNTGRPEGFSLRAPSFADLAGHWAAAPAAVVKVEGTRGMLAILLDEVLSLRE